MYDVHLLVQQWLKSWQKSIAVSWELNKGNNSIVLEIYIFLIEYGNEPAATFWVMILNGQISPARHRRFSSGSVENKLKKLSTFLALDWWPIIDAGK